MSDYLTPDAIDSLMLPSPGLKYQDIDGEIFTVDGIGLMGGEPVVWFVTAAGERFRWRHILFARRTMPL